MKTTIQWLGEVRFQGTSGSEHSITIDGPPDSGGQNAGPRPMELVLMGTAGCATYDVVHILKKQRQDVTACRAVVEAERADKPPRVFTRIHLHFEIEGRGISEKKVARAIELSASELCSASIMLRRGGVDVQHTFAVKEATPSESDR